MSVNTPVGVPAAARSVEHRNWSRAVPISGLMKRGTMSWTGIDEVGAASGKKTRRGWGAKPSLLLGSQSKSYRAKLVYSPPFCPPRVFAASITCSCRTLVMIVPRTTGSSPQRPIVECVHPTWPTPVDTPWSDVNTMVTWSLAVEEVVDGLVVTWCLFRWNYLLPPQSQGCRRPRESDKQCTRQASPRTGRSSPGVT